MTFLEAALDILSREGKPLHYKELTDRAMQRKLLTFVGRTPEVTMQAQLTNAVKKAPGNPFLRVRPGIFGLLRYPEIISEPESPPAAAAAVTRDPGPEREDRARRRGWGNRLRERGEEQGAAGTEAYGVAEAPEGGEMTTKAREGEDQGYEEGEAAGDIEAGALSPEARAAALAETGVLAGEVDLEGEGEDEGEAVDGEPALEGRGLEAAGSGRSRGRRRGRRRDGENGLPEPLAPAPEIEMTPGAGGAATASHEGAPAAVAAPLVAAEPQGRQIMAPIDAAIEVLRGHAPGRGVHVRQIADMAVRRRLVHGEPNEAWRVLRAALAADPRERLRAGQRPRVRPAGSGLYALARRPPDMDLERAEQVFGEARRALRERTLASLEMRLAELAPPVFEAVARVLLQREGFGPATFVKRVEGTIYLEALRGRGSRPSRCLVGLRPGGSTAGRRALGELRAGIRARNQDEGLLILAGRLADDAVAEWRQAGAPVEVVDGAAMAETCVRHGIGVINTMVSVDFVDADFFGELSEA